MAITYVKKYDDGTTEVLTPHDYGGNMYRVEILVSKAEMEKYVADGARARMSGPRSPASIVTPTTRK